MKIISNFLKNRRLFKRSETGQPLIDRKTAFISYKRNDTLTWGQNSTEFVQQLADALSDQDSIDVWVDLASIAPSREFMLEIYKGIDNAANFIPVLTEKYFLSAYCLAELYYAQQQNKKIIPIVFTTSPNNVFDDSWLNAHDINVAFAAKKDSLGNLPIPVADIDPQQVYNNLRCISGIIFTDKPEVDQTKFKALLEAINSDYIFEEQQTRLQTLKREGSLLSGRALQEARKWLETNRKHERLDLDIEQYIEKSRDRAEFWYRLWSGVAMIIAMIFAGLALLANNQRNLAVDREQARATQQYVAEFNEEERNFQLQTLALIQLSGETETAQQPLKPILHGQTLWIGHRDEVGNLMPFTADGGQRFGDPIEVGPRMLQPQSDGLYIWAASNQARHLLRIQPDVEGSAEVLQISLAASPSAFYLHEDQVWVVAADGVTAFDRNSGTSTFSQTVDGDVSHSLMADHVLWFTTSRPDLLHRIDMQSGEHQTVRYTGLAQQPTVLGQDVYLAADNKLYRFDAQSLTLDGEWQDGYRIQSIQAAAGYLWLIVQNVSNAPDAGVQYTGVRFDPETSALQPFIEGQNHLRLAVFEAGVLAITNEQAVQLFSTKQLKPLWSDATAFPRDPSFEEPVSDGDRLWLVDTNSLTTYVLRFEDGRIVHRLPICQGAAAPYFDGANMWFSCRNEENTNGSLVRMPAFQVYHGLGEAEVLQIGEYEQNARPHAPHYYNQTIWFIQEVAGYLIVFDTVDACVVGSRFVGEYAGFPVIVGNHYWIEANPVEAEYYLMQFHLDQQRTCEQPTLVPTEQVKLPDEVAQINLIGEQFWLSYLNSVPDVPDIEVIRTNHVNVPIPLQGAATGFVEDPASTTDQKIVWVTMITSNGGRLLKIRLTDQTTYEILHNVELEYMPRTPLIDGDDLWLTTACKGGYLTSYTCLFGDASGALYRFDRETARQELFIEYERGLSHPITAGGLIWFTQSDNMPILNTSYFRGYHTLTAVDATTGNMVTTWSPCKNLLQPYHDTRTNYLWIVCMGIDDDPGTVTVLDLNPPNQLREVAHYADLGQLAWNPTPIQVGDADPEIWIAYRETNNIARFNAWTGELLRIYGVGNSPMPPVVDDRGYIWVPNTGSATIQRIHVDW